MKETEALLNIIKNGENNNIQIAFVLNWIKLLMKSM